jgi:hypothetical protein
MDDTEIEIDGCYTIDMTSTDLGVYDYSTLPTINVSTAGAMGSAGSPYITTGINGYSWGTLNASPSLDVRGDATFDGDIKWKGRSLGKLLETIESRLAILQEPSPEKLEKYAALKKAYEHYKTLERLIGED